MSLSSSSWFLKLPKVFPKSSRGLRNFYQLSFTSNYYDHLLSVRSISDRNFLNSFSILYQEKGKMFDTGWKVNLIGHRSVLVSGFCRTSWISRETDFFHESKSLAFGFLVSKIDYAKGKFI